jgi:hypothetical protein
MHEKNRDKFVFFKFKATFTIITPKDAWLSFGRAYARLQNCPRSHASFYALAIFICIWYNLPIEDFITQVYVTIDDYLKKVTLNKILRIRGKRPSLPDSEVIAIEN